MKKTFALIAASAAVAFATPAAAQSTGNQNPIVHQLSGEVAGVCTLADFQPSPIAIDFGTLSNIDDGTLSTEQVNGVTIICNDPEGGNLSITSANGGKLFRAGTNGGANNEIDYQFRTTGTITIPAQNLTSTPLTRTFLASPAYLNGQSITLRFAAEGVRAASPAGNQGVITTVFAGTYTDTVTVAVTAN